jgi:MYXO-CTERM domain-containing protein
MWMKGPTVRLVLAASVAVLVSSTTAKAQWTLVADGTPSPRQLAAAAFDAGRGTTVLFGGFAQDEMSAETWVRTDDEWALRTDSGPSARWGHALAYDANREQVVLFGGLGSTGFLGDTWTWDGAGWSAIATPVSPAPRWGHGMVTGPSGSVLLIGGLTAAGSSSDTWEWDGLGWSELELEPHPSPRYALGAAGRKFDAVVFGGQGETRLGDTWSFVDAAWRSLPGEDGPGPQSHAALIGSPDLALLLPADDEATWIFTDEWAIVGTGPPARAAAASAFDSARGVFTVFGGASDGEARADTWEFPLSAVSETPLPNPPSGCSCKVGDGAFGLVVAIAAVLWRRRGRSSRCC